MAPPQSRQAFMPRYAKEQGGASISYAVIGIFGPIARKTLQKAPE
jgi:hypothetical protein